MLAALAQATKRLRMGVLVTGIHYRHPAVLANMAATIDIISGGRLDIGVGAGWNMTESEAYGIELGSLKERSDRFEEGIQVLASLLANETTDFDGTYYQLKQATCNPKPVQKPHPPICVGGSGAKRTLLTTAKYAQHWNFSFGGVDDFKNSRDILHQHCADVGRDPSEILLSSHITYDGDPESTAATAAEFGEAGIELAIIYLHPPYSTDILERTAEALAKIV